MTFTKEKLRFMNNQENLLQALKETFPSAPSRIARAMGTSENHTTGFQYMK